MSGNNVLLDTNIIIDIFSGNTSISEKAKLQSNLYVSAITVGELFIGMYRVLNKEKHLNMLTSFLELCTVLEVSDKTAKPIPTNDIWIAATAKEHNLLLVTFDHHFNEIDDLQVANW